MIFPSRFHPFLLDPTLGKTPTNKRARYEAKFGGKERVAAMEVAMKERAKEVGINLSVPLSFFFPESLEILS